MGTRGYKIVRHRGRYWVYYNHYDSYPSYLGKNLLAVIPVDPEGYKAWLEKKRAEYEKLSVRLEKALCVTEERIQDVAAKKAEANPVWKEIDDVEILPSTLCEVGNDLFIEWIYLIDLDNEVFTVNNTLFFNLWDIPRDRWLRAFETEESYSTIICPEASFNPITPKYFVDDAERDRYKEVYGTYSCPALETASFEINIPNASLQNIVAVMFLECLLEPYWSRLWEYLPQWGPQDFAFQEVAFAVLSLAAGQYYFSNPAELCGGYEREGQSNGFIINKTSDGKTEMLPIFGRGCHAPAQEAGSAPPGSMYYFEGILISLVTPETLEKDTDAAIAKAVEFGVQGGKTHFQIVIFSVITALFVEVSVKDDLKLVRHTGIVLVTLHPRRMPENDMSGPNPHATETEPPYRASRGFAMLQGLFNKKVSMETANFNQGVFPTEIYAEIISYIGPQTQLACAKVSKTFRSLCQERFSLDDKLSITKLDPSAYQWTGKSNKRKLDALGTFEFQGMKKTGRVSQSSFNPGYPGGSGKTCARWCPVIGTGARKSVITQAFLGISLD
ncbi:F-box domain-containing protein [Arthroderma uncinatum]|uniref:F-box domain-containing protein n=1 Tax=Arthroderma uncinatum TaxID=74035 RepID=UPI00144AE56E|nr:F-box domain-containing protein [Arthroderma uncinatum]KAF3482372.1 F-box domain-containing protein [Arthroderma uncinatum]